ncbi:MAG: hypothetical protein LH615_10205, partial [Ferruginibacter sp.]|nr:hypothetical protein [Ferruginibacter sp.]
NKVARCFPFGTSLIYASVNSMGNKLVLENVYYYYKVFDLQTGKMIAFSNSDDKVKVINPILEPTPIKYFFGPYHYQRREITNGNKRESFYDVKDSLNNVVMEVKDDGTYAFNARNGNMVWATGKKIILYEPGKKPRTVGKAEKRSDGYYYINVFVDQGKFSPDGRYLVSGDGYITDLQEANTIKKAFVVDDRPSYKTEGYRPFDISFNQESSTCTVSIHDKGLLTYQLSTGLLVDSSLIPKAVIYKDLTDIFQIIQIPNSKDFIYWLRFLNKASPAGIAYYIKDGVPLPLCDPGWEVESVANFNTLVADFEQRQASEKAAAEKLRKEQEAYAKAHPEEQPIVTTKTAGKKWVKKICSYCNGTGKIYFDKLIVNGESVTTYTIDQYGVKTYKKTTGGMGSAVCSGCGGKTYIQVLE